MIVSDEKKHRLHLNLEISEEATLALRGLLFENGLSLQEFLAFIFLFSQMKDANIIQLIEMAKLEKVKNNERHVIVSPPTSPNALYNLLEQRSPLKNQR